MKLKLLAAFVMMLLAFGCTQQPSTTPTTEVETTTTTPDSTPAAPPETELAETQTVSFDVTGMH